MSLFASVADLQSEGAPVAAPENGFQTLADNTEVFYHMTEFFAPDRSRGARWNDPAFKIAWPLSDPIINDRDRSWPDFR